MTTSVPSSGNAVERKERGEWKRRMGDMDGSSLGTQRAHLSGRGHLARGSCVLCRCRGGMFMVLTPTPSSLPLSTEKCSAQQQGLESLPEELPDTSSSQAVPTSCT